MHFAEFVQRVWRSAELKTPSLDELVRRWTWRMRGAQIGRGTKVPRAMATWPHQIKIGRDCTLQEDIFFNFDHYWVPGPSIIIGDNVFIGRGVEFNIRGKLTVESDCLIAAGTRLIDHNHGIRTGRLIRHQECNSNDITVKAGGWIGANAVILPGVELGEGCVVGAGAVVTRSVPCFQVWAGVPAQFIACRPADVHTIK
jgi:acetyltransferase-like isoleucine patch superfamily enzyme